MTAATATRLGETNQAGSNYTGLFLEVFGGEVMGIYQDATVAMNRHVNRTITSGKSAQFPAYGRVSASYHTVGSELVGQAANVAEQTILIDDMLVADVFLAELDELMNHFDMSGPYASEIAFALANANDQNILRLAVLAARASATVTDGDGGTVITDADGDTSAASLLASVFSGQQSFDEKNIPQEGRQLFLKPAQYSLLAQNTTILDADYSSQSGDLGAGTTGPRLAGFELVKSNNVATTNNTSGPAAYQGYFNNSICTATHSSAIGTVSLKGLTVEVTRDPRRLGHLLTARQAIGSDILRPESAIEFRTAASTA